MMKPEPNPYKSSGGFMRIVRACGYSMDGLASAFRHEAAFRQLLALAAVLVPVAVFLPVGRIEKAMLIGSVLLSLIIEVLNSAIEATVDRISTETHPLAKRAKDLGSAAQFLGLVNVALVWGIVLADRFVL